MYRDLLSFYSGYFSAALNGGFAEAGSGVIKLDTEEPAVFEDFMKWLYTRQHRSDTIVRSTRKRYCNSIIKLWIFADRRDIPLLMNEMIDSLQQSVVSAWTLLARSTIKELYTETTVESPLRRMVVDMYTSIAGESWSGNLTDVSDDCIKDFLLDLVKGFIANNTRKPLLTKEQYKKVEMCPAFHVHEEGAKCTKKGTKRSSDEMEK